MEGLNSMTRITTAVLGLFLLVASQAVGQGRSPVPNPSPFPTGKGVTESAGSTRTPLLFDDCAFQPQVTLGTTISSFLGNGSCFGYDPILGTYYVVYYPFTAIAGQTILVNYSAQFLGVSAIQDYYRATVLADSSACGLANSCSYSYTATASGLYVLSMKAYGFGTYTLTAAGAAGFCDFTPLVRDQTMNDTISPTGCVDSTSNHYFNAYQFDASLGEVLRLTYTSVSLPSLVLQIDSPGSIWGHTFVNGPTSVTLDYRVEVTGTYTLFAETQNPSETGSYTLLVEAAPPGTATTLSLGNRFNVSVNWHTADGRTGQGSAIPVTTDTGYFWFFSGNNVELVVKVLDGQAINGKWWVFYGALSNVEYTITVTDTQTGAVKQYTNPQGVLASVADTGAF